MSMARVAVDDIDMVSPDDTGELPGAVEIDFADEGQGVCWAVAEILIAGKKGCALPSSTNDGVTSGYETFHKVAGLLLSPAPSALFINVQNVHDGPGWRVDTPGLFFLQRLLW